ncbi:hypothetical protein QBC40DRAFT_348030 [Triangularia verruculosa]|uniref:Uncharacterized protein n=1 Tax=Triangularia verruculosa TaxID=2587418 RepID=A0AAN6XMG3_9PEZI|nr:hypothetical protein QBC40DRAFT_348030 [Triangularia verruculosa]
MRLLPRVALATVASSLFFSPAVSLPQAASVPDAAPLPWVTVDPQGDAETISPKVITTEGHRATLSNPPAHLISTATYTLSPDDRLSTYTGLAPVATAPGGTDETGVFLACQADKGHDEPFCLPRRGSSLVVGRTYYITWSPSYFSPQSTPLTLHIFFSSSSSSPNSQQKAGINLTPLPIPASTGFYAWTIPLNFPVSSPISFALQHNDTTTADVTNDIITVSGPTVNVVSSDPAEEAPSTSVQNGTNILAIVLPIVIAAVLLGLAAFCFLSYRRKGKIPVVGGFLAKRRSGRGGYTGQGARRVQDVQGDGGRVTGDHKSETNVGVELTDRDSWSPTSPNSAKGGRNVFREEVERQERLARGG